MNTTNEEMKLFTVAEVISCEIEEPVLAVRGRLIKLYDPISGEGQYGQWTLQNGSLKDATGEIKVQFSNCTFDKEKYLGQLVEFRCKKSPKGGWTGVKRTVNKKDKTDVIQVSSAGEVILINGTDAEPPNGHATAPKSSPEPSRPSPNASIADSQETASETPRRGSAELMADGLGEMAQIANAQYAAIMTVHEYLVPLCKAKGITIDAQQEAALVQNLLIQSYYQRTHWKFPSKRFPVKQAPSEPSQDQLDQSGPETPF